MAHFRLAAFILISLLAANVASASQAAVPLEEKAPVVSPEVAALVRAMAQAHDDPGLIDDPYALATTFGARLDRQYETPENRGFQFRNLPSGISISLSQLESRTPEHWTRRSVLLLFVDMERVCIQSHEVPRLLQRTFRVGPQNPHPIYRRPSTVKWLGVADPGARNWYVEGTRLALPSMFFSTEGIDCVVRIGVQHVKETP
ncbi:hypothetical protein [Caenimonas koreensis]|uniref:Uncharacterized protein n=1 Tax=Caenimonas koreensis DSM 17982 TaxID=1121255 RepID=A0A844B8M4_9BURK|nr:hypothetical protein [Caenimonas koreensis]MRD49502.1 hypothetical protein [Caenimonas koreensis DSM 17982]